MILVDWIVDLMNLFITKVHEFISFCLRSTLTLKILPYSTYSPTSKTTSDLMSCQQEHENTAH